MKALTLKLLFFSLCLFFTACNENHSENEPSSLETNFDFLNENNVCYGSIDTMLIKLDGELFLCPHDSVVTQIYIGKNNYLSNFFNEGMSYYIINDELILFLDTLTFGYRAESLRLIKGEFKPLDSVFISFSSDFVVGDNILLSTVDSIYSPKMDLSFLKKSDIEVKSLEYTSENGVYLGELIYLKEKQRNSGFIRDNFVFYSHGKPQDTTPGKTQDNLSEVELTD